MALKGQAIEPPASAVRPLRQAIECRAGTAGLRGQAMMEYLVTYGWALLALFLVIALLIASGAFSPDSFSTQECTFQPGLPCAPYIIYKDTPIDQTVLKFTLTNGLGFPINVTGINYTVTDIGQQGRRTMEGSFPPSPMGLVQGGNLSFEQNFTGPQQPPSKQFRSIYATIYYLNCRSSPCTGPYVVSGRISAMVEQKQ